MSDEVEYQDIYTKDSSSQRSDEAVKSFPYNILYDALIEQVFVGQRHPFLDFVRGIETGDKITEGVPKFPLGQLDLVSSIGAKGYYQFTDETVASAKKRALMSGISPDYIKNISDNPGEWSSKESDIMFLANMFLRGVPKGRTTQKNKPGRRGLVDDLLEKAFINLDRDAMEDLYYTIHHITKFSNYPETRGIPPSTIARVNKMNIPEYNNTLPDFIEMLQNK